MLCFLVVCCDTRACHPATHTSNRAYRTVQQTVLGLRPQVPTSLQAGYRHSAAGTYALEKSLHTLAVNSDASSMCVCNIQKGFCCYFKSFDTDAVNIDAKIVQFSI